MTMTNAQAALIAASSLPWNPGTDTYSVKGAANDFKAYLDGMDEADRQRALYGATGR